MATSSRSVEPRPALHLTPKSSWLNDPNGLWFEGRRLHATFQLNPLAPEWGRMHWGHAVSDDLVSWLEQPIALHPGAEGPDAGGCWSGSVVRDGDRLVAFYTGVMGTGDQRVPSICRATSGDGLDWVKDPTNPIIGGAPQGIDPVQFRDPYVFRDGRRWAMLVGAGAASGRPCVLLYRSADLRGWTFVGTALASEPTTGGALADGPIWECPQLVRSTGVDVLIVSVMDPLPGIRPSHVMAFAGRFADDRFTPASCAQLGMGPDFYAPATSVMPDGRCLLLGWIPEDPPAPGAGRSWAGSLTLPRILSVDRDGRVRLALAEEVRALRTGRPLVHRPGRVAPHAPFTLRDIPPDPVELVLDVAPGEGSLVSLDLIDDDPADPVARLVVRESERALSVARRGIVSVAGRAATASTSLPAADGPIVQLRLILDASVLEVETNGHIMATLRLPHRRPGPVALRIAMERGDADVRAIKVWVLGADSAGR